MTKITTTETTIQVVGEYNAEFIKAARRLAGKWKSPAWVFDIRDEAAVRAACLEIYGTDGYTSELVDVRVTIPRDCSAVGGEREGIQIFGRTLARASGRDSGARLGGGVVVEAGGFGSGGSMKNWTTTVQSGTVCVLRDVSKRLVDAHDDEAFIVEVLSEATPSVDQGALIAEREKLTARLAQIDTLLKAAEV